MDDDVLTIEQAADLLGCSTLTIARGLRSGRFPGVKIGRHWRLSRRLLVQRVAELIIEENAPPAHYVAEAPALRRPGRPRAA